MSYLPSMGNASLLDVFKAYPELAAPLHEFAHALMRGPSPLSPEARELIAAYVSGINSCEFCLRSHLAVAERFGLAAGTVSGLLQGIEPVEIPERLKPILRYVRKLTESPECIAQADVDAVYAAGWDEKALCHAALVCGFFNLMNRWVAGLGLSADPRTIRQAAEHLYAVGYRDVAR